jgi:spermidine synthase
MTKNKEVIIYEDRISLSDEPNTYVMMSWETELMSRHVDIVCQNGGDILEIGFGLGISANFIQQKPNITSHTIIEINNQILEIATEWAKDKPNVTIVSGDWFDVFPNNDRYDGILYDADCSNILQFRKNVVDSMLKTGGIFTYFEPNGKDIYRYDDRLIIEDFEITVEIPQNQYHNDKNCKIPYFINN